jgi:uncharacterized membrane protein YhaH (DUF805 family)
MRWLTTKGRISRGNFVLYALPSALLGAVLKANLVGSPWDWLVGLLLLLCFPVAILAGIRRSHDLGHSGWLALILFVPFAGLYFVFKEGAASANEYGPPPP